MVVVVVVVVGDVSAAVTGALDRWALFPRLIQSSPRPHVALLPSPPPTFQRFSLVVGVVVFKLPPQRRPARRHLPAEFLDRTVTLRAVYSKCIVFHR